MSKKILVVEDNSIVAFDIQSKLEALGFHVPETIRGGENVNNAVSKHKPDLLLMDIKLDGEINGIQAAKSVRKKYNIPIVFLTAYADDETLKQAKKAEPYGYLLKPFEERDLRTTIEIALYKHKMEKKVKESRRLLRTTLKSIGDAVISTDEKGLITFFNPAAEKLLGWDSKEALGLSISKVLKIRENDSFIDIQNLVDKIIENGEALIITDNGILITKDRKEIPVGDSIAPINGNKGIEGVVITLQDLTDRKAAESKIMEAELRYRTFSNFTQDWEYWITPEAEIRFISPSCERITGYTQEEFISNPELIEKIIYPEDSKIWLQHYQEAFHTDTYNDVQFRIIRKDNNLCWIEHVCKQVRDENDNFLGFRVSNRDISRRKKAEAEICRLNAELEDRVIERTQQLMKVLEELREEIAIRKGTEDKLRNAKVEMSDSLEKEKELNDLKTRLISMISHEYRTPLTIVLSSSYLIEELYKRDDKEKILDHIRKIQFSVSTMTRLLENAIAVYDNKSERKQLNIKEIDLNELARLSAAEILKIDKAPHLFKYNFENEKQIIRTDEKVIKQIVLNVISNAVKYSPDNQEIIITTLDSDDEIRMSIKDNGIGIPIEEQSKIFDAFYRGKNIDFISGAGLGLTIVKQGLERLGGKLEFNSRPGAGSEFTIILPKRTD